MENYSLNQEREVKMKVIVVTKPTIIGTRRCLNCGKDISHKRSDAQFCCPVCYEAYHGQDHRKYKEDLYLFNAR